MTKLIHTLIYFLGFSFFILILKIFIPNFLEDVQIKHMNEWKDIRYLNKDQLKERIKDPLINVSRPNCYFEDIPSGSKVRCEFKYLK